jgi:hypothetical protein
MKVMRAVVCTGVHFLSMSASAKRATDDVPDWDALNPVVWPSIYGTFERPDRLAPVVFE